jgi:MarR family transcriptional regulator for hemolysin
VRTQAVTAESRDLSAALVQGLLLASRRWRARLNQRLKRLGQTDARCVALIEIAASPDGVKQRELSLRLGVEEPTVVRLVDALEAAGLVERRAHSEDRRAKLVCATPQAQAVATRVQGVVFDLQGSLFEGLDPGDLAACQRVLAQLCRRLDRAD